MADNSPASGFGGARRPRVNVVTGATGHLGNVLVRGLLTRGSRVRAVVRPDETIEAIAGLNVDVVRADVRDYRSLAAALVGADTVYHLAGLITISGGKSRQLYEVNVLGVRNVVRACLGAGVRRLV